jgi:hypothetical protein
MYFFHQGRARPRFLPFFATLEFIFDKPNSFYKNILFFRIQSNKKAYSCIVNITGIGRKKYRNVFSCRPFRGAWGTPGKARRSRVENKGFMAWRKKILFLKTMR